MLKIKPKQLSFYSVLYNKIPENHLEDLINILEDKTSEITIQTKTMIEKAKDILNDPKFINQKGVMNGDFYEKNY